MVRMDWLKTILGDALTEEHLAAIKKELPKHFALKSDFNDRGKKITDLEGQLDTVNNSIKDLTTKADLSDTLKADLDKINGEFVTFKEQTAKKEKDSKKLNKYKEGLAKKFNPDAVDLLLSAVDADTLQTNEAGEIVDMESKLTTLAEARPNLVLNTELDGSKPKDRIPPGDIDWSKKTDKEYYAHQESLKKTD